MNTRRFKFIHILRTHAGRVIGIQQLTGESSSGKLQTHSTHGQSWPVEWGNVALLTPADVHHGRAQERIAARQTVLDAAYDAHPEHFVRGRPKALQLAPASYINRPAPLSAKSPISEDIQSPEVKVAA